MPWPATLRGIARHTGGIPYFTQLPTATHAGHQTLCLEMIITFDDHMWLPECCRGDGAPRLGHGCCSKQQVVQGAAAAQSMSTGMQISSPKNGKPTHCAGQTRKLSWSWARCSAGTGAEADRAPQRSWAGGRAGHAEETSSGPPAQGQEPPLVPEPISSSALQVALAWPRQSR